MSDVMVVFKAEMDRLEGRVSYISTCYGVPGKREEHKALSDYQVPNKARYWCHSCLDDYVAQIRSGERTGL